MVYLTMSGMTTSHSLLGQYHERTSYDQGLNESDSLGFVMREDFLLSTDRNIGITKQLGQLDEPLLLLQLAKTTLANMIKL